jgi:hypothetical protein
MNKKDEAIEQVLADMDNMTKDELLEIIELEMAKMEREIARYHRRRRYLKVLFWILLPLNIGALLINLPGALTGDVSSSVLAVLNGLGIWALVRSGP